MKKIIRIIVGNSAYTDDSGFGYSALKVRDLKDNQLKEIYKEFSEVAFIPSFKGDFPKDSFKYLEIISFRRIHFLLFGKNYTILNESAEAIAKKFTSKDIYLVNAINSNTNKNNEDSLKRLVSYVRNKYEDRYLEIYILYLGSEAKKLKGRLKLENVEEYCLYHPAYINKDASRAWINFEDKTSKKIKNKFSME